ncbi:MAG: hypothetical protein HRT42_01230 [Campylobacteraceae bacterium]|nr:hypothetical protein [Campylobacteraceae bacterium]
MNKDNGFTEIFQLTIFSLVGSILGSLHFILFLYKKIFDLDHLWGFFFSPILDSIIGLMVLLFSKVALERLSTDSSPVTAKRLQLA